MRKISRLKEWLALGDASQSLSALFNDEISESDILQLSLERQLILSCRVDTLQSAYLGKASNERGSGSLRASLTDTSPPGIFVAPGNSVVNLEQDCTVISGLWDLTMSGEERVYVINRYRALVNEPPVDDVTFNGVLLKRPGENLYAQLLEYLDKDNPQGLSGYFPLQEMPGSLPLVVRTKEFQRLVNELSGQSNLIEDHVSDTLRTLLQVGAGAWRNTNRDDRSSYLKNKEVEQLLEATPEFKGNAALKKWGAIIVRPGWASPKSGKN